MAINRTKRASVLLLSLCMALMMMFPVTAFADGVTPQSADATVSTFAELQNAVAAAPTTGTADGTPYVIEVTADFALTSSISIGSGKNILIRSDSTKHTLTRAVNKTFLFIMTDTTTSTLTFENIVLDGAKGTYTDNTSALIYAINPNVLNLNSGTVLQNNMATSGGGAVRLSRSSTATGLLTFSMDGATVKDNTTGAQGYGGGIICSCDSI